MTTLSDTDVRHIAKLARVNLTDDEVPIFAKELSAILDYIDVLGEVETSNVEPTAQITGQHNSFREDVVLEECDGSELVGTTPLPIAERQIQTPSAH